MAVTRTPALAWLVGTELPRVFEKHFRLPATVPPQGRVEATPYIAFTLAVCAEDGDIPLDLETAVALAREAGLPEETE